MAYTSLWEAMNRIFRLYPFQTCNNDRSSLDEATATKLFSYLICHGEDCSLDLNRTIERLNKFTGRSLDEKDTLDFLKANPEKFDLRRVDGKQFVEAKTAIKLCDAFQKGKCRKTDCNELHICRFFLQGSCEYGDGCKKPHSFDSLETRNLLHRYQLDSLPSDALQTLFKKVLNEKIIGHTSASSGPELCKFYNKRSCKSGDKCKFLHVCEHYVNGDCKFGAQCKRSHHFQTPHSRKVLADRNLGGLRNDGQILSVLRNGSESDETQSRSPTNTDEKLEICGFHLRGKCSYGDKCNALHTYLPYQWQYFFQGNWKKFSASENQKIEKAFCNCEENLVTATANLSLVCSVDFQTMSATGRLDHQDGHTLPVKIRRLSTVSSVLAATGHVFRTKWKWYWKDEHDQWQSYDDGKADTTSEKIEQDFVSETGERKHIFSTDLNKYTLYFDNSDQLYQVNDKFKTKRDVRRRPARFLDEEGMKQVLEEFIRNRQRTSTSTSETTFALPPQWAPVDSSEEFKVIDLEVIHEEFTKVKTQFLATMPYYKVKSVKRVQNPGLWEDYERQKSRIAKKNAGNLPDEKWLFHGTNKDTVDPICQQGFDWRLSGSKHGAVFGKGSYFALDASYSRNYSGGKTNGHARMFLAKVIVGSYVVGDGQTQRPPAKNSADPLSPLHDSCVNDVKNPTIFVVFERSQAYPYYIIDYEK